ncbi:MAG: VWA domain-containing protein [Clostridia bacterium]|nr:VWA domain-containing protein [Clostridia bacterium]
MFKRVVSILLAILMLTTCMTGLVTVASAQEEKADDNSNVYDVVLLVDIGSNLRGNGPSATKGAEVLAASLKYMLDSFREEATVGGRKINLSVVAFSSATSTFFESLDMSSANAEAECAKVVSKFEQASTTSNGVTVDKDGSGIPLVFWNGGAAMLRYAYEKALSILSKSSSPNKDVIVCSDFNVTDKNDPKLTESYDTILDNNISVYPIAIKGINPVNSEMVSKLSVDVGELDANSFIANDADAIPRVFVKVLTMLFDIASNESEKVEVTKGANYTFKFRVIEEITDHLVLTLTGAPVTGIKIFSPDNIDVTNNFGEFKETNTKIFSEYHITHIQNGEWTIQFTADANGSVYFDASYYFYNLSIQTEIVNYASSVADGFILDSDDLLTVKGYIYNDDTNKRVSNSEVYALTSDYSLAYVDSQDKTLTESVVAKPTSNYYQISLKNALPVNTYNVWVFANLDLTELCGITLNVSGKEAAIKVYVNYITLAMREITNKTSASRNDTLNFVFDLYSDINKVNKLTTTPTELIGKNVAVVCYANYNQSNGQGDKIATSDVKKINSDFLTENFKVSMKIDEIGTLTFIAYVYGTDINSPDFKSDAPFQVGVETSVITDHKTIGDITGEIRDGETYKTEPYVLSEAFSDSDGHTVTLKDVVNPNPSLVSVDISEDGKLTITVKGEVSGNLKLVVGDGHGAELTKTIKIDTKVIKPTITVNGNPSDIIKETFINKEGKLDAPETFDVIDLAQFLTHSFGREMKVTDVKLAPAAENITSSVNGLNLTLTANQAYDGQVTVTVADANDGSITASVTFALKVSAKATAINTNKGNAPDKIKVKFNKGETVDSVVDLTEYLTSSDAKALKITGITFDSDVADNVKYTVDGLKISYTLSGEYKGTATVTVEDEYGATTSVEIDINSKFKTSPVVTISIIVVIVVIVAAVVYLMDRSKKVKSLAKYVKVTITVGAQVHESALATISSKRGLFSPTTVKLTNRFSTAESAIVSGTLKNIEIKGAGLFGSAISYKANTFARGRKGTSTGKFSSMNRGASVTIPNVECNAAPDKAVRVRIEIAR